MTSPIAIRLGNLKLFSPSMQRSTSNSLQAFILPSLGNQYCHYAPSAFPWEKPDVKRLIQRSKGYFVVGQILRNQNQKRKRKLADGTRSTTSKT